MRCQQRARHYLRPASVKTLMDKTAATVAVVITGADLPTDLATARSLRRLHVEMIGLHKNKKSAFVRSRLWDRLICLGEKAEPGQYLDTLHQLGRSASRPMVLFPTQDEIVQLVSDHREELSRWFKFVLPPKETVDTFLDKTKFHPWAMARGFPVPDSRLVSVREELESALSSLGYPVIFKPLHKTVEWERHGRQKAYRLNSRLDFESMGIDIFQDAPRFIVQRWIEGGDADVHFCLTCCSRDGEELGYYTGKKLLQWPIGTGSTAVCVGTENGKVRMLTRKMFQAGQFRGLGS
jgi:D-aspartate ligase